MQKQEARQRIKKLREIIDRHRYLYHVLDKQEISDAALDSLKHELFLLESQYPDLITKDSPTQRVAGRPLKGFIKVPHKVPMLSIEDIFSEKELQDWQDYLKKIEPGRTFEYFCELKIDGFAVSLIYNKGVLETGSTRGSGRVGEDVTQNLKPIESIPLTLQCLTPRVKQVVIGSKVEVRGEVYMEKRDFEKLNKELAEKGQKPYANPRNLAAGSIRQLDPKLAASRPLKFIAYDLVTNLGQKKHSQKHKILKELGFKSDQGRVCFNLSQVLGYWKEIVKNRAALPYQVDGVVVSVNDNALFAKFGVVGKSPRGIRAFKFSPKQAATKVLDIKVQVGRTGTLTPVAVLEPVEVGGVVISRATLHNEDEIKRLGVKIGDTVIVGRAGDVIPDIVKVLPEMRTGHEKKFVMPGKCPVCGSATQRPQGEVRYICKNPDCFAVQRQNFYHFASRQALNIMGLGPKIIDKLIDQGLISDFADIFKLKEGDLIPLERFAEKSAENIIRSIHKSEEKIPLARFIYALGILHVGEETAIDLAQYFGDIKKLAQSSKEELERIPDIGKVVAESIYGWFKAQKNQKLLKDLLQSGLAIIEPPKLGRRLAGKTFVITGVLESLTRDEAKKRIRMFGGKPSSAVSKETDFLILGVNPGSKLEKARVLGVKIIKEKEFLKMIR